MPDAASVLAPWSNFAVIAGSSAATLTGLMFVVVALAAGTEQSRRTPEGAGVFATPTVLHFCAALVASALLTAPWRSLAEPRAVIGVIGSCGVIYLLRVMRRTRQLRDYRVVLEEWVWYTMLPGIAYATLIVAAILLPDSPSTVLFAVAGAVLLLILIGIHNAWDVVTFLAFVDATQATGSPATGDGA